MLINRVTAARSLLLRLNVDAMVISDLKDIRYLSGFSGSEGLLLVGATENFLLTDSRYTTQAIGESANCTVIEYRERIKELSRLVVSSKVVRLAFQATTVTYAFYEQLKNAVAEVTLVPVAADSCSLRSLKDVAELGRLQEVARIASESFLSILPQIVVGSTEKSVALALEFAMRTAGADDKAFDTIVASGERGALPHGRATNKVLQTGELVTIDFGAILAGYNSDETVTLSLGQPDPQQKKVYQVVKDAHDFAIAAIKPGILFKELDAIAREYIALKGFGDYFGHGLGHGVGLDLHENPVVSYRNSNEIIEGMVFTIEPGVYLPGWGGVRIEDTVCVTADGCNVLTRVPKDLLIL
jgi:Xaa-Pro aminopeptidase